MHKDFEPKMALIKDTPTINEWIDLGQTHARPSVPYRAKAHLTHKVQTV